MNKIHITQEYFEQLATILFYYILPIRDQFEWIVGIERGGIPLSTWMAAHMGKKHSAINISFYGDGDVPSGGSFDWGTFCPSLMKTPFLLIDDIVDTGRTIKFFKQTLQYDKLPPYWIATLHWCPERSPDCKPDFYAETKRATDWIIYPWEVSPNSLLDKQP